MARLPAAKRPYVANDADSLHSLLHAMHLEASASIADLTACIAGARAPARAQLAKWLRDLNRLDEMLDALPPFTEYERVKRVHRPVDICSLVAQETVAIEATAESAGIRLDRHICTRRHRPRPEFVCDELELSQLMKNLLLNAMRYTARGGRVRVTASRMAGVLALEIADSGPGVPVAERQLIFEYGVRGSSANRACGSGVGLAVARAIVAAYGGTLDVKASSIGGAAFTVCLPGGGNSIGG